MEEEIKSEGKCLFCGKTFAKAGISRHLATHLTEKSAKGVSGKSFFVKVETRKKWGNTPYFLSLWVDGEAKMKDIDDFLRKIWLECCGHLSAFTFPKQKMSFGGKNFSVLGGAFGVFGKGMGNNDREIAMSRKVKDVLYKSLALDYEYDFGTSTYLTVTVVDEYPNKADKKIVLLSRNEPLRIMCSVCGKAPAIQMCTSCMYTKEAIFCIKCAQKHEKECDDFTDYASMPVVNSPRMGVCGYEGGSIDVERDGPFEM